MASVALANIYEVLFTKLKALPLTDLWVDLDIGQLDSEGEYMPLKYPAVLIKFADVIWKDTGGAYQMGLVNIAVKFAYKFQSESQFMPVSTSRAEVRECLTMLSTIHAGLDRTSGDSFSEMKRYNQYQLKTNPIPSQSGLIWVNVIQYQCNIQGNDAMDDPSHLDVDYDDIRNNNSFLERHRFNLLHK